MVFDGAANGPAFEAYTEQPLAPSLSHSDVAIIDAFTLRECAFDFAATGYEPGSSEPAL